MCLESFTDLLVRNDFLCPTIFSSFLALHLKGGIKSCELIWTRVYKLNTISLYGGMHFHPNLDYFFSRIWPFSAVGLKYQAVCSLAVQFSPTGLLKAMFHSEEIQSFATISNLDYIPLYINKSISKFFLCQLHYYTEQTASFLKTTENRLSISTWIFFCIWKWRA